MNSDIKHKCSGMERCIGDVIKGKFIWRAAIRIYEMHFPRKKHLLVYTPNKKEHLLCVDIIHSEILAARVLINCALVSLRQAWTGGASTSRIRRNMKQDSWFCSELIWAPFIGYQQYAPSYCYHTLGGLYLSKLSREHKTRKTRSSKKNEDFVLYRSIRRRSHSSWWRLASTGWREHWIGPPCTANNYPWHPIFLSDVGLKPSMRVPWGKRRESRSQTRKSI